MARALIKKWQNKLDGRIIPAYENVTELLWKDDEWEMIESPTNFPHVKKDQEVLVDYGDVPPELHTGPGETLVHANGEPLNQREPVIDYTNKDRRNPALSNSPVRLDA